MTTTAAIGDHLGLLDKERIIAPTDDQGSRKIMLGSRLSVTMISPSNTTS